MCRWLYLTKGMSKLKILLHACCGPCATYPVQELTAQGHELMGFFFNPNIHPYLEYQKRLETFQQFAAAVALPVIIKDEYDLETFFRETAFREKDRCRFCYYLRLKEAARYARKGRFDAFTTTLLVSPYQDHLLIQSIGQAVALESGVPFFDQDFRAGFSQGAAMSREMGLYRQPYCGCLFSERDRYQKNKRV